MTNVNTSVSFHFTSYLQKIKLEVLIVNENLSIPTKKSIFPQNATEDRRPYFFFRGGKVRRTFPPPPDKKI